MPRLRHLLQQPRAEWQRIGEEPEDLARGAIGLSLLSAVPALSAAIGLCAVGLPVDGGSVRLAWLQGLELAAALFVLIAAGLVAAAAVTNIVAPTFGGRRDSTRALRLVWHAAVPALLGGIFLLLPMLWPLSLVAALVSAWLVVPGLPALMRCPPQRAWPYAAVVVLAGAVMGLLVSDTLAHFHRRATAGEWTVSIATASAGGTAAEAAVAPPPAAAVDKPADLPAAPIPATAPPPNTTASPLAAAPTEGPTGTVPAAELKAALPETLGTFARKAIQMQGGRVGDREASNARADYANGEQRLRVELTDLGNMRRLMAEAGAVVQGERDNAAESERTWQQGGRILRESYRKDGSLAQVTTTLRNGVVVDITGQRMSLDEVKAATAGIDLSALETLQRHSTH